MTSIFDFLAAFAIVYAVTSLEHFSEMGRAPLRTLLDGWGPLKAATSCRFCLGFWAGLILFRLELQPEAGLASALLGAGVGLAAGFLVAFASPRANEHLARLPRGLGGALAFAGAGALVGSGFAALYGLHKADILPHGLVAGLASAAFCLLAGVVCDLLEGLAYKVTAEVTALDPPE